MRDAASDRGSLTRDGTWSEPQADWLPILRAVFRFAIAHSDRLQSTEDFRDDSNPFSIEAFEKFKSCRDYTGADVFDNETKPLSLHNLTLTLRDKARAHGAEIDLDRSLFGFSFNPPTGGSTVMVLYPWSLAPRREPVKIDPRLELEALFNKGTGFCLVSDEESKQKEQQYENARAAASYVWNQLMLRAFDRSVSSGRVKVYARVQSRLAQFQLLPADLWSRLEALNWYDGGARDPEGNCYYSIHAADSLPKVPLPQTEVPYDHRPKSRRRPGRQKGEGSYATVDLPLLEAMKALISSGEAASAEEAARQIANKAHGGGTLESKAERLARRFRSGPI
jgi:hypothetical protein